MDEIPRESIFVDGTLFALDKQPRVCRQHEFRYFVNFYRNSEWLGTILSKYGNIRNHSLNVLRTDSKAAREIVHKDPIDPGGYHFTSCGSYEMIAEKIKSWAHQEFNNSAVLRNLDRNIRTGQDIFEREQGTNLTKISIDDERFFDKNLATILRGHPDMVCEVEISVVRPNLLYGFLRRVGYFIRRVIYKLSTMVRKA
jgi:hypothetical protein